MVSFRVNEFTRKPNAIKSLLKTTNGITTTSEDIRIMFPERYVESNMATIDNVIKVIGIYAILDNKNNYAVMNIPIMQELTPSHVDEVSVDGVVYKMLYFNKNSVVMPINKLIVNSDFIYVLFNDFFAAGRVPWYLDYTDLSNVFLESNKYLNNGIGKEIVAFELLASIVARDPEDLSVYYRLSKSNKAPGYAGLNNLYYSYNNTGSKLVGSYLKTGLINAMIDPETKESETTKILRQ